MTTIVACAKHGVMVSESKCTGPGGDWMSVIKVFRAGDALVGTAGDAAAGELWLEWLRVGKQGKPPKGEVSMLILRKTGVAVIEPSGYELRIERGFHAVGSGAHAALGALHAGASPADAVRIACKVDAQSGGRVRTVRL